MSQDKFYVKHDVSFHEYEMHKHVSKLNIVNVPEIISYDMHTRILTMQHIDNLNLSDMYGENEENIDTYIFDEIRRIIKCLYHYNIEYPDITGYNFIEHEKKIWIIDFEHSKISGNITDSFILKFINGLNKWNPEYK